MDVHLFEDPDEFAARAQPVLAAQPILTNVIGTWLRDVRAGQPLAVTRWFLIEDGGQLAGVAMHSAGHGILFGPLPPALLDPVAERLTELVAPWADEVAGADGGIDEGEAFARAWQRVHGGGWSVVMKDWIYTIEHGPAGPEVPGWARLSTDDDADVLVQQLAAFNEEVFPGRPPGSSAAEAAARVKRRPLHVWESEGEIVSLAGLHAPVNGVSRIGPVYTPPQHRRRGFGGAVTAHAARTSFAWGAHTCMLFADRANPASNSVYSGLGFRRIGGTQMLAFDPA